MAVQVLRSSSKTRPGAPPWTRAPRAEDSAVSAVVGEGAREAVWACCFNDGTCAPEEITLLEDLQNVPVPGEDGDSDWLYWWEQRITRLL